MFHRVRSVAPVAALATAFAAVVMVAPATNATFNSANDGKMSISTSSDPAQYPQSVPNVQLQPTHVAPVESQPTESANSPTVTPTQTQPVEPAEVKPVDELDQQPEAIDDVSSPLTTTTIPEEGEADAPN